MANYTKLTDLFTGIANSIRSKTGSTNEIIADDFPSEINNIVTVQEGTSDATASASNIDSGKTAYVNGKKVTGTSTKVNTSDATASASNILTGKTAYVNGSKITGTMANQGAQTSSLNCGGSYTIPAGYHNGSGKVTANSLASQTSATASAAQILSGYTAYVNGNKITGTFANNIMGKVYIGTATYTGSYDQTIYSQHFSLNTFQFSGTSLRVGDYLFYSNNIVGVCYTNEGDLLVGIVVSVLGTTLPASTTFQVYR